MSTTPIPIDQFAAAIRAKHPGAYDKRSDAELVSAYVNKYPVYKDRVAGFAKTEFEKQHPGTGWDTSGKEATFSGEGALGAAGDTLANQALGVGKSVAGMFLAPMISPMVSGYNSLKDIYGEAKAGWQRGEKESPSNLLARPGEALLSGAGSLAGMSASQSAAHAERGEGGPIAGEAMVPAAEAALAYGTKAAKPLRSGLAKKLVEPLVYENLGETRADTRMNVQPEQAILDESLVGSKKQMSAQADKRLSELKSSADNILQNHPNAMQQLDVNPIIDSAIDDAIKGTQKVAGSTERLEALRDALKTKYGKTQGTPYEINNLKTSIQEQANNLGAYRNTQPVEASLADAMRKVASGIKDKVNQSVPEATDLNSRMSNLIDAKAGLDRNILAERGQPIEGGFHRGFASTLAHRTIASAPVRSTLAATLNAGSALDVPAPRQYPFSPPGPLYSQPAGPSAPTSSTLAAFNPPNINPVGRPPSLGFPPETPDMMWTPRSTPFAPTWELPQENQPFTTPGRPDFPQAFRQLPDFQSSMIPSSLRERLFKPKPR